MGIKGVLFDKDGVLVDFQRTYAPATAEVIATLAGQDVQKLVRLAEAVDFDPVAVSFSPKSLVIAGTAADIAQAWHPVLDDRPFDELLDQVETLYDELTLKHVCRFDDVVDALAGMKSDGLKLGVATNDTQESAHRHLRAIGQTERFTFISGYDSGHGPKPEPGMILAFAKAINAAPGEVIMVGDSLHDLHAGRAAGAVRVGITTGLAEHATLAPHADHVVASLTDLRKLAQSL